MQLAEVLSIAVPTGQPDSGARCKQHCALLVVVFCLATAAAEVQPADATTISVSVQRRDDAMVIEASALLKADIATAWRMLTNYAIHAKKHTSPQRPSSAIRRRA